MNNRAYPARTAVTLLTAGLLLALLTAPVHSFAQDMETNGDNIEAVEPVTAIVLGTELSEQDPDRLRSLVMGRILNDYVNANDLQETEDEVFTALALLENGLKAEQGDNFKSIAELPANERVAELQRRTGMASFLVLQWKLNKALFDEFGGRVALQGLGPLALDAQYALLLEYAAAGDFELLDEDMSVAFWAYFTDAGQHRFMTEAAAQATFATPPWERALEP